MPPLPDLSGLGSLLRLVVAFLGAYLFAVWVSMIIWTYRDIRSRSRDIFAQVLAVSLVLVFNIAGLLLYFILRPRETLAEKYERELAEEAMLQDIEERQVCPVCHHKITAEYLICPNCHTSLKKKCTNCSRILNLKWNVCPYCGTPQAVTTALKAPSSIILPEPTRERKREPVPLVSSPFATPTLERGPGSNGQLPEETRREPEEVNPAAVPMPAPIMTREESRPLLETPRESGELTPPNDILDEPFSPGEVTPAPTKESQ